MDMSLSLVYSFMFWIEFLLFFIMEHWKFGMVDVEYLPRATKPLPLLLSYVDDGTPSVSK